MSLRREVQSLCETCMGHGWPVERTRKGHYKVVPPVGSIIVISSTPSDRRTIQNTRALIKRAEKAVNLAL